MERKWKEIEMAADRSENAARDVVVVVSYLLGGSGSGGSLAESGVLEEGRNDVLDGLVLGTAAHDVHGGSASNVELGVVEVNHGTVILVQVDLLDTYSEAECEQPVRPRKRAMGRSSVENEKRGMEWMPAGFRERVVKK
jgi:hypothetical protein